MGKPTSPSSDEDFLHSVPPVWVPVGVLLLYGIGRIVFDPLWQTLSPQVSYISEGLFVLIVASIYRERIRFEWPNRLGSLFDVLLPLVAGFALAYWILSAQVLVPFDFKDMEVVAAALLIGPIIEEGIFRVALWEPIRDLFRSQRWALVLTTLTFALSHGVVYGQVPVEYRPFVIIQVLYVLILGLAAGARKIQTQNSLIAPLLVHTFFNLGFYLAMRGGLPT